MDRVFGRLFAASALLSCTAISHAANLPRIAGAIPNYSTIPPQLTIGGTGFGASKPTVVLGGFPLLVLNYTDTSVTVQLPLNLAPGSYELDQTNNDHSGGTIFTSGFGVFSGSSLNFTATITGEVCTQNP